MTKKKDDHKTERTAIQLPKPWADVAKDMASEKQQPLLWLIMATLAAEADKQGRERPALPWDE